LKNKKKKLKNFIIIIDFFCERTKNIEVTKVNNKIKKIIMEEKQKFENIIDRINKELGKAKEEKTKSKIIKKKNNNDNDKYNISIDLISTDCSSYQVYNYINFFLLLLIIFIIFLTLKFKNKVT